MRAGRMDRYITIQETSQNTNGYNDPRDVTWSNITEPNMWAKKINMRGSEDIQAGKETATSIVRWEVRWRDDLTEEMRIEWNSNYYYITAIRELGRQRGLQIDTELRR